MIRKLYLSISMFIILFFIATTFTYAWFSMATTNSVEELTLMTYSDSQLEISVDGINYYNNLPYELLLNKVKDVKFTDITSTNGIDFSYGIRKINDQVIVNKDYISIDFFFRTTSPFAHLVYLSNNVTNEVTYENLKSGTFITSEGRTFKSDVDFLYGPDEMILKDEVKTFYAKDSIRVSTIERPIDETDLRTDLLVKIFDLTENPQRGYGLPYGSFDYYNKKVGELKLPTKFPNTINKLSEFSNEGPFAYDDISHILTLIKTDNRGGPHNMVYYEGKITLNIWTEGWDVDLFDSVFNDHVKMQFEFKAVHEIIN